LFQLVIETFHFVLQELFQLVYLALESDHSQGPLVSFSGLGAQLHAAVVLGVFAHFITQQFALILNDDFFLFAEVDFLAHYFIFLLDLLLFG
jgi:hypothetical protein